MKPLHRRAFTLKTPCRLHASSTHLPSKDMSISRRRFAFTLIELLVVISIISLLIALLLPALGKARNQAKITQCLVQLRQINVGLLNYATDFKGTYLPATGLDLNGPGLNKVRGVGNVGNPTHPAYDRRPVLLAYISGSKSFYCPDGAMTSTELTWSGYGGWDTAASSVAITYSILAGAGKKGGPEFNLSHTGVTLGAAPWFQDGIRRVDNEREVLQPSRAPFAADFMACYQAYQASSPGVYQKNHAGYLALTLLPQVSRPEQGFLGGNTVYFDGHARWRSHNELSALKDTTSAKLISDPYMIYSNNNYLAF